MRLCRCGAVVKDRCKECNPSQTKPKKTAERGYDNDWRRMSEVYRAEKPLCEACVITSGVLFANPSTECHHIRKVKDAEHLRLARANVLAVCSDCHERLEDNIREALDIKAKSDEWYEKLMESDYGTR